MNNKSVCVVFVLAIVLAFVNAQGPKKVINVELLGHCALGAAPVGPGGSWQTIETNVEKICPKGSSCRNGACNCDDLPDGSVMSASVNSKGESVCRRVAGQKCSSDDQCYKDVQCLSGVCTCDKSKPNSYCVDSKSDVYILA